MKKEISNWCWSFYECFVKTCVKSLLIIFCVVMFAFIVGCEESHKQVFKPIADPNWVKEFGDADRTAYNLVSLDRNNSRQHKALGDAIVELSKKISDMNDRVAKLANKGK